MTLSDAELDDIEGTARMLVHESMAHAALIFCREYVPQLIAAIHEARDAIVVKGANAVLRDATGFERAFVAASRHNVERPSSMIIVPLPFRGSLADKMAQPSAMISCREFRFRGERRKSDGLPIYEEYVP